MAYNSYRGSNNYEGETKRRGDFSSGDRKENSRFGGARRAGFGDSMQDNGPVEFEKEFYTEHSEQEKMTNQEVEELRNKFDITITGDGVPKPCTKFEYFGFPASVMAAFKSAGYSEPTPIQAQGWPLALSGRDMVGVANTGSGKTLSFILPALIHAKAQKPLRQGDGPIVLVLAPTRELVSQIEEEACKYAKYFGLRTVAVFGGAPAGPQKGAIRRGAEILIATPGRLIDLYEQKAVFMSRVSFLVLDEADRMLDMGFEPQLKKIIPETNPNKQTLMWSATWPKEVRSLARNYMKDYIQIKIGSAELVANVKITQKTFIVDHWEKDKMLSDVLADVAGDEKLNPKIIIFCNQKRRCDDLVEKMQEYGWPAEALHGDKPQNQRDRIIQDFKSGKRSILVATDVAARGLDVKDVKAVINYDFPTNCEDYIHRIGRTARGNSEEGLALTFFSPKDDRSNARKYVEILKDSNQEVPQDLAALASRGGDSYGGNSRFGGGNRFGGSSSRFGGGNSRGRTGGRR
ncbi:ATP-dependent RNA helicase DDX17 [Nematocida ausubeli]|uniref:RNA helicase n=1 Tax=Nematocida ausubeli (strain ATCC PRA-371 / ERTm2) TaxID=1913371 RepID=H8ZAS1_NEMA1|nr:ATP-dependent RNA helicase DBP2 [Nematocida ausubeli]KAI5137574.1 ATP-dependent RNA helicase DDX17 [Nematocida ausubeli]KAI5164200.1 ATP-dependent RNA helicase DDX17 [Nematocida ausubeli]KAI5164422.1 ATP-dependent RNA helicase DDX17 [Nematocida ausubeli]